MSGLTYMQVCPHSRISIPMFRHHIDYAKVQLLHNLTTRLTHWYWNYSASVCLDEQSLFSSSSLRLSIVLESRAIPNVVHLNKNLCEPIPDCATATNLYMCKLNDTSAKSTITYFITIAAMNSILAMVFLQSQTWLPPQTVLSPTDRWRNPLFPQLIPHSNLCLIRYSRTSERQTMFCFFLVI